MQTLKQITPMEIASMLYEYQKQQQKFDVKALLKKLNLNNKFFAIVINGKSIKNLDTEIKETDNVVILPKIAGG